MRVNESGLEIIKHFEGWSSSAYICPAGYISIGYGSCWDDKGIRITDSHPDITRDTGTAYLKREVSHVEKAIERLITAELTENMFSAIGSLAYNIGTGALQRSTLRMKLNRGNYIGASQEFPKWRRGGGKILKGLVLRRAKEKELFLS
jgi:lysozyme|tara:strand:+ start:2290 stop:2733 length:444 start_codon:yes stop_codon:yes gene_type:complete